MRYSDKKISVSEVFLGNKMNALVSLLCLPCMVVQM